MNIENRDIPFNTFSRNVYDIYDRLIMKVYYTRGGSYGGNYVPSPKGNKKRWVFTDRYYYSDELIPNRNTTSVFGDVFAANMGSGKPVAVSRIYKPELSTPFVTNIDDSGSPTLLRTVKFSVYSKSNTSNSFQKGDGNSSEVGLVWDSNYADMNTGINNGFPQSLTNSAIISIANLDSSNIIEYTISSTLNPLYIRSFVITEIGTLYSPAILSEY